MTFDFMMASGLICIPVKEFVSLDIDVVTWDPYKYDSLGSGAEKVENNMNSLSEGVREETIGDRS